MLFQSKQNSVGWSESFADLPHDTGYRYPIRIFAFLCDTDMLHFDTDFSYIDWEINHVVNHMMFLYASQNYTVKRKKGKFLYSAVSSPQDRSKRFTLYFPDKNFHWYTISASLGSIQPYATINARRLLVHISTTIYSQILIHLYSWMNWSNVEWKNLQHRFLTPGSHSRESEAPPLSYCALWNEIVVYF